MSITNMPYFCKSQCLFIHIPKNAGSTIESIFEHNHDFQKTAAELFMKWSEFKIKYPDMLKYGCSPQHYTYEEAMQELSGQPVECVFALVRHPVRRLISEYFYQKNHLRLTSGTNSFENFIHTYLRPENIYGLFDRHLLPQHVFLHSLPPHAFVFRVEKMAKVFQFLKQHLKMEIPSQKHKLKNVITEDICITEHALHKIIQIYAHDFNLYQYDPYQTFFDNQISYQIINSIPISVQTKPSSFEIMFKQLQEKKKSRSLSTH